MRGNFIYRRLGVRLISERKRKKLSQEQLALLCDIDRTYVARIEGGKANPTFRTLYKIARILRIKLKKLFGDI